MRLHPRYHRKVLHLDAGQTLIAANLVVVKSRKLDRLANLFVIVGLGVGLPNASYPAAADPLTSFLSHLQAHPGVVGDEVALHSRDVAR